MSALRTSGATQNKAARRRPALPALNIDPPAKDPARPYNGGVGEAAKLPEDGVEWLSMYAPASTKESRQAVLDAEKADREWLDNLDVRKELQGAVFEGLCENPYPEQMVTDGYDPNCGMEPFEVFVNRLMKACFVEDMRKALVTKTSLTFAELKLAQREAKASWLINTMMDRRRHGYSDRPARIDPATIEKTPAVLPQDLQAASEVQPVYLNKGDVDKANAEVLAKATSEISATPHKTTVIRNGTELINPEWRPNRINGKHDLHYETNHGILGAKYVPASINAVIIEHLIKTNGLVISGEMPDWVKALIDELAAKPTQSTEEMVAGAMERRYPVEAKDITRLMDAITDAVEHPKRADQPELPYGFVLVQQALQWTAEHPMIDRTWVVASRLDYKDDLLLVIKRGEVREMVMLKMKAVSEKRTTQTNGPNHISETVKKFVDSVKANGSHAASQPVTQNVTTVTPVTSANRDAAWNVREFAGQKVTCL